MQEDWKEKLTCAIACSGCQKALSSQDLRILSSYTHEPICMDCKAEEELKPDYADISQQMIGQCMAETEILYG
ncbi:MAG: hypothetical protein QNI89_15395, partial [Desulfobacterales bacterium]|nr:hypothetical protein [Desulfobacterales bacterium]